MAGETGGREPDLTEKLLVLGAAEIRQHLSYEVCIPLMRTVMTRLSRGETKQPLRTMMGLPDGQGIIGNMPGALGPGAPFGNKIVSVLPKNHDRGLPSHQGAVLLFEPATGALRAVMNATEITAIRTASASAAATDALARPGASRLAILGYGDQARAHAMAISLVRNLSRITLWGRSKAGAARLAAELSSRLGVTTDVADSVQAAVVDAEIICTTTAAAEPILKGEWVGPGTHLNVVGSSGPGPSEIDSDLVLKSQFFVDCRDAAIHQAAELLYAKQAGLCDDRHILAEIGAVFDGAAAGRIREDDVTLYKSLGIIVQDLASAQYLYDTAKAQAFGHWMAF